MSLYTTSIQFKMYASLDPLWINIKEGFATILKFITQQHLKASNSIALQMNLFRPQNKSFSRFSSPSCFMEQPGTEKRERERGGRAKEEKSDKSGEREKATSERPKMEQRNF